MNSRALVVFSGGNNRAVLSFVRAMEICHERPYIVARGRNDEILHTSHAKYVVYTRATQELTFQAFKDSIRAVRESAKEEELIILPSTEFLNTFLLFHRSNINSLGVSIPLVNINLYDRLTNKESSTRLFSNNGFPVPRVGELPTRYSVPLVAKPKRNVNLNGQSLYPIFLTSQRDLDRFKQSRNASSYFFQKYVSGESHYLFFFIPKFGGPDISWSQRNLMQQPNGKSILLAEPSRFYETAQARQMIEMLREVGYYGMGMIEIIKSEDKYLFIEMNPRIWGPVQFCLDQKIPILQAFIGEALYNSAMKYANCQPKSRPRVALYMWLGGLIETLGNWQRPRLYCSRIRLLWLLIAGLSNDIQLRRDSWRTLVCQIRKLFRRSLRYE